MKLMKQLPNQKQKQEDPACRFLVRVNDGDGVLGESNQSVG